MYSVLEYIEEGQLRSMGKGVAPEAEKSESLAFKCH